MITKTVDGRPALKIFEQFQSRPQMVRKGDLLQTQLSPSSSAMFVTRADSSTFGNGPVQALNAFTNAPMQVGWANLMVGGRLQRVGFRQWLADTIRGWAAKLFPGEHPTKTFNRIFSSFEQLAEVERHTQACRQALQQAVESGQVALAESLSDRLKALEAEARLVHGGFPRYLQEEDFIRFVEKCDRHLQLDWLSNFARPLPADVREKLAKAEATHAFDNFVVLHYDPLNRGRKMTKAEVDRAKDPILWGVIASSRRLYFVADWQDELCDLTLDKLIGVLGRDLDSHPTKEAP